MRSFAFTWGQARISEYNGEVQRRIVLAIVLAAMGASSTAQAFCRSTACRGSACTTDERGCPSTGKPLYWRTACIGYSLQKRLSQNLPQDGARLAIQRAFQAWAEVDCGGGKLSSLNFSPLADVSCNRAEYNERGANVNLVTFKDDDWTYKGIDNNRAKTTVTFDGNTGEIFDADIEINSATNQISVSDKSAQYDLQSILTHEVGHLIGLAHSDDPSATMFASYAPGSTALRSLSDDDIAAVCAAYPPDRVASCESTPRGGLADTCSAEEASSGCGYATGSAVAPMSSCILLAALLSRSLRARRRRCDR
jgi:hypothetical protein